MALYNATLKKAVLDDDGYADMLTGVPAGGSAGSGSGFIYLFAGTPPTDADAALDMSGTHTYLGTISSDAGGSTGVSFGAATSSGSPATAVLPKNSGETWSTGAMTFAGHSSGSGSLTATFARMGTENLAAIEGAGSTTARAQFSIASAGDPPGDINLPSAVMTAGSTFTLDTFQLYE